METELLSKYLITISSWKILNKLSTFVKVYCVAKCLLLTDLWLYIRECGN